MATVIDYAWARPSVTVLHQAGAVAVCRYLSWLPNGKCLTRSEADTLRAAGIDVVSNWEYFGDWANDYSGGRTKGRSHAAEAARQHVACGGPAGRPIYFSTDFDPTAGQLPTIADYYRGVADVIGLDRTGAYGGYRTIKYLFDQGVIRWGWQTYAWSGGQWDSRVHVRQVRNGVKLAGTFDVDFNETQKADFGQWGHEEDDVSGNVADFAVSNVPDPDHPGAVLGMHVAVGDLMSRIRGVQTSLQALAARPAVQLTDAQVAAVAERIAAELVGSPDNGLSDGDLLSVRDVVRQVLDGVHFVAQDAEPGATESDGT